MLRRASEKKHRGPQSSDTITGMPLPRRLSLCKIAILCMAVAMPSIASTQAAARGDTSLDGQRAAMAKLSFLVGRWSGPITLTRGLGEPMRLTQTEQVQMKLDGLLLLIEGTSRDADGKVLFQALATVAFDTATNSYRFRAYNDGRYLDTELSVPKDGFSWSFEAGPAHINNSMHLTANGDWAETTDAVVNGAPPRQSMQMILKKQP